MRHYIYIDKKNLKNSKIYGSAKSLLDNEKIEIDYDIPKYRKFINILGTEKIVDTNEILIMQKNVVRSRNKK
jgi:hypothetical protein